MTGLQNLSLVQLGTSDTIAEWEAKALSNAVEETCIMDCSQSLKISRCGGGESVVNFIARCPQLGKVRLCSQASKSLNSKLTVSPPVEGSV
jgi:hypothetical protein